MILVNSSPGAIRWVLTTRRAAAASLSPASSVRAGAPPDADAATLTGAMAAIARSATSGDDRLHSRTS